MQLKQFTTIVNLSYSDMQIKMISMNKEGLLKLLNMFMHDRRSLPLRRPGRIKQRNSKSPKGSAKISS